MNGSSYRIHFKQHLENYINEYLKNTRQAEPELVRFEIFLKSSLQRIL